jgi:hypothetical protein
LLAIGWTALTAVAWAGLGSYRVNLAAPVHGATVATVGVDSACYLTCLADAWAFCGS